MYVSALCLISKALAMTGSKASSILVFQLLERLVIPRTSCSTMTTLPTPDDAGLSVGLNVGSSVDLTGLSVGFLVGFLEGLKEGLEVVTFLSSSSSSDLGPLTGMKEGCRVSWVMSQVTSPTAGSLPLPVWEGEKG